MERASSVLRCLTGIGLGIGLLVLLNQLEIPFYLYFQRSTQTVLISANYDLYLFLGLSVCVPSSLLFFLRGKLLRSVLGVILMIWTAGLLALTVFHQSYALTILYVTVVFAAVLNVSKALLRRRAVAQILTCALAIPILIESSALGYWADAAFNPQGQIGLVSQQLELRLTFSLFPIAVLMMLLLLMSWLWIPVKSKFLRTRQPLIIRYQPSTRKLPPRLVALSLDLFAIVAIVIFFYTYLAGQTWIVGVDSYWRYLNPLKDLAGLSPSQAFVSSYTHGLYVAVLYLIELASGVSPFSIVKFAPLILAFGTASAVFLMIVRGGWSLELGVLSSICALLWLPTTLGFYAGLQANWVAYLFWMLFLALYFQTSKRWNTITIIIEGFISLIILLIHPWTWGVFFVSILLTIPVSWRTEWKTRSIQGAIVALIFALTAGAGAYLLFPNVTYDMANTIELYSAPLLHPASLLAFGGAMVELFLNWGSFIPPLLLLISLIGAYSLCGRDGLTRNYLVGWIATWCIGSVMVAPSGFNPTNPGLSETGLWRMLYVSPLPILLALGIQRSIDLSKALSVNLNSIKYSLQPIILSAVMVAVGAGLFSSNNLQVRLLILLGVIAMLLLYATCLPENQNVFVFVAIFLVLILVNSAFRSLYPLLLDPHNLFGPVGVQR